VFRAGREIILSADEGIPAEGAKIFKPENHIKTPFLANRIGFFISIIGGFLLHLLFSIANYCQVLQQRLLNFPIICCKYLTRKPP